MFTNLYHILQIMQKSCYKRLINTSGDIFCDTLKYGQQCFVCITKNAGIQGYTSVVCPNENSKCVIGKRTGKNGKIYACGQGYGKNSMFVYDLDCLMASLQTLSKTQKEIDTYINEESVTRIRRVLHNIRSINAHSLQEMRSLVPEYVLRQHKEKSCDEVEGFVKKYTRKTAMSIFRVSKDLYEIKAEFSVYDKLIKGESSVDKRPYNIRDVIMTVLYPFFEDFNKKDVIVNVESYYKSIPVDFETFQVAIYHIIENASKYIRKGTNANISFDVLGDEYQLIRFQMQSLFITQEEKELIFNEGYSGISALDSKLNGDGIGMFRAKRLIELNGGTISVDAGTDKFEDNELCYANNTFLIKLPLR